MLIHLLLTATLVQQQKISLTKPDAEYSEPFTQVRSVRELANGKVLVSDIQDKIVQLVDFAAGSSVKIGREGQGPEEYLFPMGLYPMPDGSTVLQDMGNRRFLPILADGRIGKAFSPPAPPARTAQEERRGQFAIVGAALMNVRGADAKGKLYFQGMALPAHGTNAGADSVPIMTWDRVSPRIDTIAWLPIPADQRPQVQRDGGRTTFMVRLGSGGAWPKQTSWLPAPDGRIAIVSPEPYQVTWINEKRRTAGPVIPVSLPKVTEADRKEWLDRQAKAKPMGMIFVGPGGGNAPPSKMPLPNASEVTWPETLPVFTGNDAVQMTPEGQVWVQRVKPVIERTPSYDVFDGTGKLVGSVTLRPKSRVAGFGKGTVYVVRTDDDDLQ
ncbi:MAG TPA: hypothetical protein VJU15_16655, partial [Gemmatimonadales bacterium]|nr:hypothetical protein [Gemmatimonadales bacterium]